VALFIALLLQKHPAMSTKSVCSSQYMVTDQHWATGAQIILSDRITEWQREQNREILPPNILCVLSRKFISFSECCSCCGLHPAT